MNIAKFSSKLIVFLKYLTRTQASFTYCDYIFLWINQTHTKSYIKMHMLVKNSGKEEKEGDPHSTEKSNQTVNPP